MFPRRFLLIIALCLAPAFAQNADLIVYNGKIVTVDPRSRIVDAAGDELLSRARLALDEHRDRRRRGALHEPEDLDHRRRAADHVARRIAARAVAPEHADLRAQPLGRGVDLAPELRVLDRDTDAARERGHPFRILRAHKNRFGSTNEIGVFEMKGLGLVEVPDPSALFLAERPVGKSGSVVTSTLNGTRPLLVEVQALVAPTGYGTARRTAIGVDGNRVALLAAVLEKKEDIPLVGCDLFVNVAGGMQLSEPACDLAVCAALVSSLQNRPMDPQTLVLGEVGLAGEVRAVGQVEPRLAEAAKMGFQRVVLPSGSARRLEETKLKVVGVETLGEALSAMFD